MQNTVAMTWNGQLRINCKEAVLVSFKILYIYFLVRTEGYSVQSYHHSLWVINRNRDLSHRKPVTVLKTACHRNRTWADYFDTRIFITIFKWLLLILFSHGRLFPSVVYHQFYTQWPQSSTCFFHFSVIFYANCFQVHTSACFSQPPSFDFLDHDCRTQFSFNYVQGNFLFLRINVPATFIFKRDPSSREHLTDLTEDHHLSLVALSIQLLVSVYTATCVALFIYKSPMFACRTINCLLSDNHWVWLGTQ
jgi:hypothetical protein